MMFKECAVIYFMVTKDTRWSSPQVLELNGLKCIFLYLFSSANFAHSIPGSIFKLTFPFFSIPFYSSSRSFLTMLFVSFCFFIPISKGNPPVSIHFHSVVVSVSAQLSLWRNTLSKCPGLDYLHIEFTAPTFVFL